MNYFKLFILFLYFSCSFVSNAQTQKIVLEWTDSAVARNGVFQMSLQTIKGFDLDLNKPFFAVQQDFKSSNGSVEILNVKTEKVPLSERQKFEKLGVQFSADFEIDAKIVSNAGKPLLSVQVLS
jgi:hypothetical protein